MSERARALEQALRMLRNECHAIMAMSYDAIKDSAGYTNLKVWIARVEEADALLADPPPSGASPQAETSDDLSELWRQELYPHVEPDTFKRFLCDLTAEGWDDVRKDVFALQSIVDPRPAPVSPVEPEPPEELPCYCDIPSHILDLGCPRHQAPQCEPEPPKTWSLERAQKLNEIADRVVVLLFVNGFGEHADRLVMKKSKQEHGDLGGWSRDAVKTVILEVLRQEVR